MKNILIPTMYECDTVEALKIASGLLNPFTGNIIMTSVSDVSDSIQDLLFLSSEDHIDQHKRRNVIESWIAYQERNSVASSISLREHHQFGISRPLLNSLLEGFSADLIIVPSSFHVSRIGIHRFVLELLYRSNCPVMLLPFDSPGADHVKRALFLGGSEESVAETIKQLPLDIVHQSIIEDNTAQSLRLLIDALDIELVVHHKRKYLNIQHDPTAVALGVPVLAV